MSAIAAVVDLRGDRLDPAVVERVVAAMSDRGPDGTGTWVDGPVGLGHQSLALTPEEVGEHQPVLCADLVGVFDGRLDNRAELLDELCPERPDDRIVTDAELAVRAYDRWPDDAANHLIGDFGLAVWDARRGQLLCARDPLGMRPIYYSQHAGVLVIATDIRGVLAHPSLPKEPDEATVAAMLVDVYASSTATLYEGVARLPPAHALRVEDGVVSARRYWDVDLERELDYPDQDDYVEHFMSVFSEAVRCRLRARDRVTIALSGGRDSSLVAGVASRIGGASGLPAVTATSVVFPGLACDESPWIDMVVDSLGIDSRRIAWAPATWDEIVDDARRHQYLPSPPNATYDMFVRAGMRRSVVLSGSGGDEWMNGYNGHFLDLWGARRYGDVARNVAQGGGVRLARAAVAAARFHVTARVGTVMGRARPGVVVEPAWLGPRLRGLASESWTRPSPPVRGPIARPKALRYGTLHAPFRGYALEATDQALNPGSLVGSSPFCDRRVVEFALALPDSARWRGAERRWVERRALASMVPAALARRTSKAEFTPCYSSQLRALEVRRRIPNLRVIDRGWVAAAGAASNGLLPGVDSDTASDLWIVMAVEAWARSVWG